MIERIKNNKALKILLMIIKAIISLFIVIVISIIFIQRISNNKLSLGGYSIYTIITESMEPKYKVYDMVISKNINTEEIKNKSFQSIVTILRALASNDDRIIDFFDTTTESNQRNINKNLIDFENYL